jgi:hypothetical protein
MNLNLTALESRYDGHALVGFANLFGANHHVRMIRVQEGDDVCPFTDAPEVIHDWFEDAQKMWEGAYERFSVPGFEGKFVMFIFPFAI